jgi:hypothetical protein
MVHRTVSPAGLVRHYDGRRKKKIRALRFWPVLESMRRVYMSKLLENYEGGAVTFAQIAEEDKKYPNNKLTKPQLRPVTNPPLSQEGRGRVDLPRLAAKGAKTPPALKSDSFCISS